MTARAVKTAGKGESNGEGLRGSAMHAAGQAILSDIMPRKRPAHPSICQEECLPIPGSVIKSSERPTTVVGKNLSRKSQLSMKKGYEMNSRFWTGVTLGVVALLSIQCERHVDQQIMLESDDRDLGTSVVQPASIEDIIKETKAGYIKRTSEIRINATPSDIVVVMMGASGGPDGNNTLGGSGMTNQGFKLINLAGDSDCRIEGWVTIWDANDGNNVMIPLSSKDSGYGIVVIDGTKAKVNPSYLNNSGEIVTKNGRVTGLNTNAKDGHLLTGAVFI